MSSVDSTPCAEHQPAVAIGPGGYPYVRCFRCPVVIPRDEVPTELLLDCLMLIRGESCRGLTDDELSAMYSPESAPPSQQHYLNRRP